MIAIDEKIFDVKEVAKIFHRSETWVRAALRSGSLVGTKYSNKDGWNILESDLNEFSLREFGVPFKDFLFVSGYDAAEYTEKRIVNYPTKDARICPYCGARGVVHKATNMHQNADGYLVRYRMCDRCHVIRKTYEVYPEDFDKLVKLKRRVEDLATELNKACEEAK
jgi:hypothetical protein